MRDGTVDHFMISKPILEINPTNPLVVELRTRFESPDNTEAVWRQLKSDISNMYGIALISGGFYIADVASLSQQLNRLLAIRVLTDSKLPGDEWDDHFRESQQDLTDTQERKQNLEHAMSSLPEEMRSQFMDVKDAFPGETDSVRPLSDADVELQRTDSLNGINNKEPAGDNGVTLCTEKESIGDAVPAPEVCAEETVTLASGTEPTEETVTLASSM